MGPQVQSTPSMLSCESVEDYSEYMHEEDASVISSVSKT